MSFPQQYGRRSNVGTPLLVALATVIADLTPARTPNKLFIFKNIKYKHN